MDIRRIAVLGSTGSIGLQALDVADRLGLRVTALSAGRNIKRLEEQARRYKPEIVSVMDEKAAGDLKTRLSDCGVKVVAGVDGLCEAAAGGSSELVLNAVVGIIGLRPTLAAIGAKKDLAIANKETLVAGGNLVMGEAKRQGVRILPVDSEHSAIFQCLQGCADQKKELKKIILTASGGPFFGMKPRQLKAVTKEQALRHPNWTMGPKITVDSATLMNKGLELIEAAWLFGVKPEKIEILIHRESIIHSMVEFTDNTVVAQLGVPDMRLPIQYAMTYPGRYPSPVGEIDFLTVGSLTFSPPDEDTFQCLKICKKAIREGGLLPAAANAANEKAVELFLKGEIGFLDIGEIVRETVEKLENRPCEVTLGNILETDRSVKAAVSELER